MSRIATVSGGRARALVALFFVLLTLIGLMTVRDYGAPFDEIPEMGILMSNLKEYALRLEGEDSQSRAATLRARRISLSVERDHGICAYYPFAPYLLALRKGFEGNSYAWSVLTWAWFMLGCVSLYGVLRALGLSRPLGCAAVLLLYLCPRFFAEGHYNNKDIVLLCLCLWTLWMGARFLKKPGFARGLIFSLAGAMAANTKIAGAFAWGLMGLAAVVMVTASKGWTRRVVCVAIATVGSFAAFYALLTPAMWSDPIGFFEHLIANATHFSRIGGVVLFRGAQFYDFTGETPLPWYYLPYYLLTTLPLYTLALAAAGQFAALRALWRGRSQSLREPQTLTLAAATLMWSVPVLYAMLGRPLMYNGWRHFYFVYAGLAILAGYGAHTLWRACCRAAKRGRLLRGAFASALCLCLVATGAGVALNHPYEFAYYNPLVRRDATHTMEMDTWNVGAAGALRKLYDIKKDEPGELRVGCYFNDITIGEYKLPDDMKKKLVVTAERDEPYLYYGSTYAYIFWAQEPPQGYHELFRLMSYDNTVGVMYQRD